VNWITNVEAIAEWLRSLGAISILASILLNILISVTGVLPSIFLSGANAIVFGISTGFLISLIGEVLGAGLAFVLYRWGITKTKWNKLAQANLIRKLSESARWRRIVTIVLLRMNPLLPSGVVTFTASLTTISFFDFMVATLIGKTPSMVFETFVGHDLVYLTENKYRLVIALLLGGATVLVLKFQNDHSPTEKSNHTEKPK